MLPGVGRRWTQRAFLHTRLEDVPVQRQRKVLLGHDPHGGVRSRTSRHTRSSCPDAAAARKALASCVEVDEILRTARAFAHDRAVVACAVQRLGELPKGDRRRHLHVSRAVAVLVASVAAGRFPWGWDACLCSIVFATLKRSSAEPALAKTAWASVPPATRREAASLGAALACATALGEEGVRWGVAEVLPHVPVPPPSAAAATAATALRAAARHWDALWAAGLPKEAVGLVLAEAIKQGRPREGWEAWRVLRANGWAPSTIDVTVFMHFVSVYGLDKEIRWAYEKVVCPHEEAEGGATVDARYLWRRCGLEALLYCANGDRAHYAAFLETVRRCDTLPEQMRGLRWEDERIKRLAEVTAGIAFASRASKPTEEHKALVQEALNKRVPKQPVEGSFDLTVHKLGSIFA